MCVYNEIAQQQVKAERFHYTRSTYKMLCKTFFFSFFVLFLFFLVGKNKSTLRLAEPHRCQNQET